MIDTAAFGRTGHRSTRVIFGAAALGAMRQEKADQVFDVLLEYDKQCRFSWYEPLRDPDASARAVRFVLGGSELFLNSCSDATLLRLLLDAATHGGAAPGATELEADVSRYEMQPLFVWGGSDGI